jgi:hypothetical protein
MPRALKERNTQLRVDAAADQAIAACGGDARGRLFDEAKTLPLDRKDWYD